MNEHEGVSIYGYTLNVGNMLLSSTSNRNVMIIILSLGNVLMLVLDFVEAW